MDAEPNYDDLTGIPTATQRDVTGLLLPLFVGWQIQLLLFGLCLSMFYDYLQSDIYARHTKRMKASLWGIIALLCMTSLLSAEELCYFGVWQKRSFLDVVTAHWPSGIEPILTAFVGSWVQVLLTLRAAAFFPKDWRRIAFLLVNFSLIFVAMFGACCVGAIGWLFTYGNPDDALPLTFYNSTIVWLFATAGVDVAISAGLAVQVRKRLADAGVAGWAFKSLITTALQTAAYTALFAVGGAVAVIAALATGNTPSTIDSCWAFWLPMPSLYVLSLFTTLGANASINLRLVEKDRSIHTAAGYQPGRLAASYAVQPASVGAPPSPRHLSVGVAPSSVSTEEGRVAE